MTLTILPHFHYSTFIPRIYKSNTIKSVKIKFDESCKYSIQERSCVNKLWGFSSGLFGVHKNSYRFGWTYDSVSDKIIIWAYIYRNGKLFKERLAECNFDVEYTFTMEIKDKVTLTVGTIQKTYEVSKPKFWLLELGFYFGGVTRSPHKMKINFKRI